MTIGTTTALNCIQGALRRINSYQSGETIAIPDAVDCLDTFNDLLDSLSLDKDLNFGSNENILYWTAGQKLYKVGNPVCTLLGSQPFTGTVTSGSPTITGVTNMPANLVAGANAAYTVGSGSILTDTQGLIPLNSTVLAFNAVAQTVTMSTNATGSSSGLDTVTYTVPGDFPIDRPIRITHGFTRFNNLDFTLDVYSTEAQYTEILYKAQPGPWPVLAWYNNTFPYGLLNVYQTPGNGASVHLFTQNLLTNLTLNQVIVMPQGYNRMLKWILAKEICAEFGFPCSESIKTNAQESMDLIKALNSSPAEVSKYDGALTRGDRGNAGWIMTGGYR